MGNDPVEHIFFLIMTLLVTSPIWGFIIMLILAIFISIFGNVIGTILSILVIIISLYRLIRKDDSRAKDWLEIKILFYSFSKGARTHRKNIRHYLNCLVEGEIPEYPFPNIHYDSDNPFVILSKRIWKEELKRYKNRKLMFGSPNYDLGHY